MKVTNGVVRLQVTVAFPSQARPLFSSIPVPFRPPRATGSAHDILSAAEAWLAPLLAHPNLEGALHVLKEIGNLLAFVSLLDEAVVREPRNTGHLAVTLDCLLFVLELGDGVSSFSVEVRVC